MTSTETVPPPMRLTCAEQQTLALLADGNTYRIIARQVGITEDGVRLRCVRMFAKLGAKSQAHAVHIGHQIGAL